jgi:hypothetical protein
MTRLLFQPPPSIAPGREGRRSSTTAATSSGTRTFGWPPASGSESWCLRTAGLRASKAVDEAATLLITRFNGGPPK